MGQHTSAETSEPSRDTSASTTERLNAEYVAVRSYLTEAENAQVTDEDIAAAASVFVNRPNPRMVANRLAAPNKWRRQMPQVPDELTWSRILGVLVGQADGEVFIPHSAVVAVKPFRLEIEKDLVRDGWFVRLLPAARIDG